TNDHGQHTARDSAPYTRLDPLRHRNPPALSEGEELAFCAGIRSGGRLPSVMRPRHSGCRELEITVHPHVAAYRYGSAKAIRRRSNRLMFSALVAVSPREQTSHDDKTNAATTAAERASHSSQIISENLLAIQTSRPLRPR